MFWKLCLFLVLAASMTAARKPRSFLACEGQRGTAACPPHTVIKVMKGVYGRKARNICPHRSILTTNCSASSSLSVIRAACDKRNGCALWARNSAFGDPCVGTHKYLAFAYTCVPEIRTVLACEHGRAVSASCSEGHSINILSGYYGRKNREQCPSRNIATLTCEASGSLQTIKDACNGMRTCDIKANNNVFGDPCPGTVKYLSYAYTCIRPKVPKTDYEVSICEGSKASLRCPYGTNLKVTAGYYGRSDLKTCPSGNVFSVNCANPSSNVKLNELCHDKNSCFLHANNGVFGDPCPGTYKYLRMFYTCA